MKRRNKRRPSGPLKTTILDILTDKPVFSRCFVCSEIQGVSLETSNPINGQHLLYSDGICPSCLTARNKGVIKCKGGDQ